MSGPELTMVRNLRPGLKELNLVLIVLEVGKPNTTKENHEVRTVRVADKTGSVHLSVWDEKGKILQPGDIVRVSKAYTSVWKNCLTLYVGKAGDLVRIGDFCFIFAETPFLSEPNADHLGPNGAEEQRRGGPVNGGQMNNAQMAKNNKQR